MDDDDDDDVLKSSHELYVYYVFCVWFEADGKGLNRSMFWKALSGFSTRRHFQSSTVKTITGT